MKKEFIVAVASIFVCMQSAYPQITTNEPPVSVHRGLGAIKFSQRDGSFVIGLG